MRNTSAVSLVDNFMAQWLGVLESWCCEHNMSCDRGDLHHLVTQLQGWCLNKTMFARGPKPPTTAYKLPVVDKQAKWGVHTKQLMRELDEFAAQGWTVAYTNGSSKRFCDRMQAGYGLWHGANSQRNYHNHVSAHERQNVSRAELWGVVLHALLQRQPLERMVVVLDSEYVYKGAMEWLVKWRGHGWRCSTGEVEHRDLWEEILYLGKVGWGHVQMCWLPSHLNVHGNQEADALASLGRELHPSNIIPLSKRRRVTEWDALGLDPMEDPAQLLTSGDDSGGSGAGGGRHVRRGVVCAVRQRWIFHRCQ